VKRGFIAAILVVALIGGIGAGWLLARSNLGGSALSFFPSSSPTGRMTVLLLGADDRPDEVGRSDTAILVTADLSTQKVTMMSIPRDTWANIPGHGWDKFNHAYAFGKEQLSLKTLRGLTGVPIDHYIVVNMQGFQKIVDSLGGVTIDVEKNMDYEDPTDKPPLKIHLKKGVQKLGGYDALGYVRFRHDSESDWGRMARQQKFLRALAAEALKPLNLPKLPSLAGQMYAAIRTDLSKADLVRFGLALSKGLDPQTMDTVELKGTDRTFGGVYYLQLDFMTARRAAYRLVTGKDPDTSFLAQAEKDNQSYLASITKEQQRQAALAKAAEDAARQAAEQPGQQPGQGQPGDATQPGQPDGPGTGTGTTPTEPGASTGGTTTQPQVSASAVLVVDASGKGLGPRYASILAEQGLQVTGVMEASKPQASTQIIVHKSDAAALQKVMTLFPGAQLVVEPAAPGQTAGLVIILGQNLGNQG